MIYAMSSLMEMEKCRLQAPWLAIALKERGQKEATSLDENNPRILEYISTFSYLANAPHMVKDPADPTGKRKIDSGYNAGDVDETPWCACFVNWCLKRAGLATSGMNAGAEGWKSYGTPILQPRLGAITVVYKKPEKKTASMTATGWHVAFYLGGPANAPTLFGGNQRNMVCSKDFHNYPIIHYRWPASFLPARMPRTRYA